MNKGLFLIVLAILAANSAFSAEPDITHVTDQSSKRVPLNTVAPIYPEIARRDRVEGDVQVCFNVDREGRPYRIAVRSSTDRIFERPSMRAVRASRYVAIPQEQEVPGIKTCRTFRFRLESVSRN